MTVFPRKGGVGMNEIAVYDANIVIDWRKVPQGKKKPRPLNDFYEYAALETGGIRLIMLPRWFGDARGGWAAAKSAQPVELDGTTNQDFDYLLEFIRKKFATPSPPIERRIAGERIAFAVPEDPRDNHLAEAAIASRARYLVTRDHHLLALRFHPQFLEQAPNTLVVTPKQFAEIHPLRDHREQNRRYLNLVLRYMHKRESGMWVTRKERKVKLTTPSRLTATPLETLRGMVAKKLGQQMWGQRNEAGTLSVQVRRRGRGGPGGGEGGSGSLPPNSGPSTPPTQTPPRQGKKPMLSIQPVAAGGDYHAYLKSEYYLGETRVGQWLGRGAKALGLTGDVSEPAFARLLDGFGPDSKALVQNAGVHSGKLNREPGWDLTFSAPKDVSVLWAVADLKTREAIGRCHAAAVDQAVEYLEAVAAFSRQKVAGSPKPVPVPAKLVIASFGHGASRERDPQLHTHCVVFNVGVRENGSTGALLSRPNQLYRHKMAAGALYRATLAAELRRELGVNVIPEKHAFRIEGVPAELSREFSKRRRQIEKELAKHGTQSAEASSVASKHTRRDKSVVPSENLFQTWREVAASFGLTPQAVTKLLGRSQPDHDRERTATRAVERAATELLERDSHFPAKALVRHAAHLLQDGSATAREVQGAVSAWLQRSDVQALGTKGGVPQYTTQAVIDREREFLADVRALSTATSHPVKDKPLQQALGAFPEVGVSADDAKRNRGQREAVEHLTSPDGISILSGTAGTGKSTVLRACREAWEKSGYTVTGIALAGIAAKNLEETAGIPSETLALRLKQLEGQGIAGTVWHHTKQIIKTAANELHADVHLPIYPLRPFKLDRKTVVVLDEAGMVPTADMARLVRAIADAGAKLVAVGNKHQLQPILAGGPFAALEARLPSARLTHVTRQKLDLDDKTPAWKREAVSLFEAGKGGPGLSMFAERGLVDVALRHDDAKRALVAAWAKEGGAVRPAENLVLANTNKDVRDLNAMCQAARLAATEQKRPLQGVEVNGETVFDGDRVLFTKKSRKLEVDNGERGTVESVRGTGRRTKVVVRLDDERTVTVPLAKYDSITLGYAMTTHKAQGATVENAFVLLGGSMQDRHITYVQASRASETTRFFTCQYEAGPELSALVEKASQDRTKLMAHDVAAAMKQSPNLAPERDPAFEREHRG